MKPGSDIFNTRNDILPQNCPQPIKNTFINETNMPKLPINTDASSLHMQDFLFLPKLVSLSQNVSSMVNQGVSSHDLNKMVKDRFLSAYNDPRIVINLNVYINDAISRQPTENVDEINTSHFSQNLKKGKASDIKIPQFGLKPNPNLLFCDIPKPISPSQEKEDSCYNSPNYKSCPPIYNNSIKKIKKKKLCNCIKKRSLEDLIRQERLFHKQVEKIKYFWRGTNSNHPFVFKKKMLDHYAETDETMINEVVDFSKKMITADDILIQANGK